MTHKIQHKTNYKSTIHVWELCTTIFYSQTPIPGTRIPVYQPHQSVSVDSQFVLSINSVSLYQALLQHVLLCPFISATSVIPPTLNLKYYQTHTHTVIVVLVYCIVLLLYLMPGQLNELY